MNSRKTLNTFATLLIVFAIGFYAGHDFKSDEISAANPSQQETTKPIDLQRYWEVWDEIHEKYVDAENIDDKNAVYGSIKGLVNSLGDPYSSFMTPDETDIFQSDLDSELQGIGAELTVEHGILTVVSPLKDSPAEKAGIKPGDQVAKIDGIDATDYSFIEAIHKIRGEVGTKVTLTVAREGEGDFLEITITRGKIEIESVTAEKLENDLFYISINQFSNDTEKEFFEAVREALLANPKGVILDLRFNGGGYLTTSVNIMSEFIEKGQPAVIVESGATKIREVMTTNGSARLKDVPLVVLVNNGSASASEILAGALQDYERAFLIGEQTFGKGTVQEVETLDDGSSLRLTIAKWYTPKERAINEEGITPDLIVSALNEDGSTPESDLQLEKAKEYLNGL